MCTVCGCSAGTGGDWAAAHDHRLAHEPGGLHAGDAERTHHTHHSHDDHHDHTHEHDHTHPTDTSAGAHAPPPERPNVVRPLYHAGDTGHAGRVDDSDDDGERRRRLIRVEQDILGENQRFADANRRLLDERGVLTLNMMSGPGAGKTTLLVRMIDDLSPSWPMAVIEGDQETTFDADRVRAAGVPAIQINTGKGCHLDARMVGGALAELQPEAASLLLIENVGNLVCPSAFDLGQSFKTVLLSVTEGEDKPLKYAEMFYAADVMLLTKIDLLPFVKFDRDRCCLYARRVNPKLVIFEVSTFTGAGLADWYAWLQTWRQAYRTHVAGRTAAARVGTGTG
jgi:hydrogenase nickel incorporation protein HypB